MHTARTGYINHLTTAKATLGLATVKRYAGEIRDAINSPSVLTDILPAALVIVENGDVGGGHGDYLMQTLIATHTSALEFEENADDALQVAEAVARWLDNNFTFTQGAYQYSIDLERLIRVQTLMIEPAYSIVQVSFDLREV